MNESDATEEARRVWEAGVIQRLNAALAADVVIPFCVIKDK